MAQEDKRITGKHMGGSDDAIIDAMLWKTIGDVSEEPLILPGFKPSTSLIQV
jgi:hypothetical protein